MKSPRSYLRWKLCLHLIFKVASKGNYIVPPFVIGEGKSVGMATSNCRTIHFNGRCEERAGRGMRCGILNSGLLEIFPRCDGTIALLILAGDCPQRHVVLASVGSGILHSWSCALFVALHLAILLLSSTVLHPLAAKCGIGWMHGRWGPGL